MKAVAYKTPGPIDREDALQDITLDTPEAEGRDLLVKINAVSVNPVDYKLRMGVPADGTTDRSTVHRCAWFRVLDHAY